MTGNYGVIDSIGLAAGHHFTDNMDRKKMEDEQEFTFN